MSAAVPKRHSGASVARPTRLTSAPRPDALIVTTSPPGQGFTHHIGDIVTIAAPGLGALVNPVSLATEAPEWTFGTAALMRNLAARGLL